MTTTAESIEEIREQCGITQDEHEMIYTVAYLAADSATVPNALFDAYEYIAKLVSAARGQGAATVSPDDPAYLEQGETYWSASKRAAQPVRDMYPRYARNAAHRLLLDADHWAPDTVGSPLLWMTARPLFLALRARAGH
jgi:hypothetical protein